MTKCVTGIVWKRRKSVNIQDFIIYIIVNVKYLYKYLEHKSRSKDNRKIILY